MSTSSVTFRTESLIENHEAMAGLIRSHYNEVTTDKDIMKLDPNWDMFEAVENAGGLITIIGRRDGQIVAYSVNYLGPHPHYKQLVVLSNGSIYVSPAVRGTTGIRLIEATEQAGTALGAKLMLWHAKPDTPLAKVLARRKNTKVQDLIFSKHL